MKYNLTAAFAALGFEGIGADPFYWRDAQGNVYVIDDKGTIRREVKP